MMKYCYDGNFEGYLTVIFKAYRVIEDLEEISVRDEKISMFNDQIFVSGEEDLAKRVTDSIIKTFGYRFYMDFYKLFLSCRAEKDLVGAKVLKKMYSDRNYILSANKDATAFRNIVKNVGREAHSYKGLIRFDLYNGVLIAKIEPKNNILTILSPHFERRLTNEKFIICDVKRNIAIVYSQGQSNLVEFKNTNFKFEDEYKDLWKTFYNSISIGERENESLRISNMPKRYWKMLHEFEN